MTWWSISRCMSVTQAQQSNNTFALRARLFRSFLVIFHWLV